MMMVELTSVPSAALPISALSDHLRLSSGFADDGSQDAQLESSLRSAMAAIEARIGKALFRRQLALTLTEWAGGGAHVLPVAPVASIDSVKLIARDGSETTIDAQSYVLRPDRHRPRLDAASGILPAPARDGTIEVVLTAGFDTDWSGVPADLQQALLVLAAQFYTLDPAAPRQVPAHVMALVGPHRALRLGGGAA